MAWKYRNNPETIQAARYNYSYIPFSSNNETNASPFYHFHQDISLDNQLQADEKQLNKRDSLGKDLLEQQALPSSKTGEQDISKDIGFLDEIKEKSTIIRQSEQIDSFRVKKKNDIKRSSLQYRASTGRDILPILLKVEGVAAKKENEVESNYQSKISSQKYLSTEEFRLSSKEQENQKLVENDYLKNSIISKTDANKKKGLRNIFVLYSKSKSSAFQIQLEQFFIPIYSQISDASLLAQDFSLWKDYLAKWMKLTPGKQFNQVFTSVGIKIKDLCQIPKSENILIVQDEEGELQFWQSFQLSHNLHLSQNGLRHLVSTMNGMHNKDEMYKIFVSPSFLYRILATIPSEKSNLISNNQSSLNISDQSKVIQLPKIRSNRKLQAIGDILNNSSNTVLNVSLINPSNNRNNNILNNIDNVNSNNNNNNSSKFYNQTNNNNNSNPLNDLMQPSNISNSLSKERQNQLLKKDRQSLVDLYSQYQSLLFNSTGKKISHPNLSPQFSQGALLKQFNEVKMKILISSFPILAKKRQNGFQQHSPLRSPKQQTNFQTNQKILAPLAPPL